MDWLAILPFLVTGLVILALVGLAIAIWSFTWPVTDGVVELSFTDAKYTHGDIVESHQLAYRYEVGGVGYLGGNVKPIGNFNWQFATPGEGRGFWREEIIWSRARDNAKWYRPGLAVKVSYCPFRPQWSCLEPGGFALPLFVGGAVAFFYVILR